jgi:DNA replication and repair protein RecF
MAIQRLEVRGLRNLRHVRLESFGRVNIISGPNGSGKTSLLEAIYLLGMGRSFRSAKTAALISHDMERLVVHGDILGAGGQYHKLGLLKGRDGEQQARIDRKPVSSLVEMARELPLQVLNSDSFSLVDGGPKVRRQFLDWGVFHVKPSFLDLWRRAQRALRQRNSLLRLGGQRVRILDSLGGAATLSASNESLDAWEKELALDAERLDLLRQEYLSLLRPHLSQMLAAFPDLPGISLDYRRGWRADQGLLELLQAGRPKDREVGYTQAGPHRATLEIKADGLPAAEVLSRGQQKLLVASLRLAQGACLTEATGRQGVYLVDDLPAELDSEHRRTLGALLAGLGAQVFITSVDADAVRGPLSMEPWFKDDDIKRFHVEQGEYRCLTQ